MKEIKSYHAHIYFNEESVEQAKAVYEEARELKSVKLGNFHTKNVGPHPTWSFMIDFATQELPQLMPWLAFKRKNLSVLVHPNTGDDYLDHTDLAVWYGEKLNLNLKDF